MNWKAIFASSRRFTPLETALLNAITSRLPEHSRDLFVKQIASINHIQRILNWKAIDFYWMSFSRRVTWNPQTLFPNRSEFTFASVEYSADGIFLETTLTSVSGHIFSLETETGLRKHSFAEDIRIKKLSVSDEVMTEKPEPCAAGDSSTRADAGHEPPER
jgi:hypothetical protein